MREPITDAGRRLWTDYTVPELSIILLVEDEAVAQYKPLVEAARRVVQYMEAHGHLEDDAGRQTVFDLEAIVNEAVPIAS